MSQLENNMKEVSQAQQYREHNDPDSDSDEEQDKVCNESDGVDNEADQDQERNGGNEHGYDDDDDVDSDADGNCGDNNDNASDEDERGAVGGYANQQSGGGDGCANNDNEIGGNNMQDQQEQQYQQAIHGGGGRNEDRTSATNLIINYLPQDMTDRELYAIFSSCGSINTCKIMRDYKTGYSFGYGFVDYNSEPDSEAAIHKLNGHFVRNKRLKVSYARPGGQSIKDTNLYVINLPRTITEEQLDRIFAPYGRIVQRNILRDKLTGRPRGVAFVRYNNREEANEAIQALNNTIPEGATQPISVRLAEEHGKAKAAQFMSQLAGHGVAHHMGQQQQQQQHHHPQPQHQHPHQPHHQQQHHHHSLPPPHHMQQLHHHPHGGVVPPPMHGGGGYHHNMAHRAASHR